MSDAPDDTSKPDTTKPDTSKPDTAKPDAAPDEPKIEALKAEAETPQAVASPAETPESDKAAGTSLAPAEAPSGIDPFLAKATETPEPAAPRPLYAKALDYSAHAAMIVGLIGFAWTVSDRVTNRKPAVAPVKAAEVANPTKPDELGDLRKTNQKMATELRNLHASLEALRATVVRDRSSGDDVRSLSASVDQVKSGLATTRSEQTTQIAQLTAKLEKLQREARQQVAERAVRSEPKLDRQQVDTTATASIPAAPKAVPTPPAKPTVLANVEPERSRADQARGDARDERGRDEQAKDDDGKPPVITGWVVREVYQGVALIEGRRGSMEVVPGVSIPGAGVVKSIERHAGAWTVTTTKGQLAFSAPQHEPRRGYRDYYGSRRYDF